MKNFNWKGLFTALGCFACSATFALLLMGAGGTAPNGVRVAAGANITMVTNGQVVTISAAAGGGATNGMQISNGYATNPMFYGIVTAAALKVGTVIVSNGIISIGTTTNLGTNQSAYETANTNVVTNLLQALGTLQANNASFNGLTNTNTAAFLGTTKIGTAQVTTLTATQNIVADYLWTDQPLIATWNGRGLTGAVDIGVGSINVTNGATAKSLEVTNKTTYGVTNSAPAVGTEFVVDFNGRGVVKHAIAGNLTLKPTNAPTDPNVAIPLTIVFFGSNANFTVTMPASMTNRQGSTNMTITITNNQVSTLSILALGDAQAASSHTGLIWSYVPPLP